MSSLSLIPLFAFSVIHSLVSITKLFISMILTLLIQLILNFVICFYIKHGQVSIHRKREHW